MSLFSNLFKSKPEPPVPQGKIINGRRLYNRGEIVIIQSVDSRLSQLGFRTGQEYRVWIDYEDLVYLESPVKSQTNQDYFYPDQIKRK